ncbi:MAG: ribulose-phosphate 3-epimerase, partial [Chitinispirillaceae bacterium]|nr:ribulose-phosphate 3-epimerase [Chitinispirillaceae bacterium]
TKISPSILAADFRNLEEELKKVENGGADRIHCDIMDGVFVPNISFGPMVVSAVKKCVSLPVDVHLMIKDPLKYLDNFCNAGADSIIVHAEGCGDLTSVLDEIEKRGVGVGVTVNPDKPISLFEKYLDRIDLVLIMSVYAGFGGQKFIVSTLDKVKALVELREQYNLSFEIEIDGGINPQTAAACIESGVDILVSGSYIFHSKDYRASIENLRNAGQLVKTK